MVPFFKKRSTEAFSYEMVQPVNRLPSLSIFFLMKKKKMKPFEKGLFVVQFIELKIGVSK